VEESPKLVQLRRIHKRIQEVLRMAETQVETLRVALIENHAAIEREERGE
jgi:hypothetical protein